MDDQSEAALLSSLSVRGGFLELAKRPPPGARVDVAFQAEDVAVRTPATVLYHAGPGSTPGGIGVLFDALSDEVRDAIESLIEQVAIRCLG